MKRSARIISLALLSALIFAALPGRAAPVPPDRVLAVLEGLSPFSLLLSTTAGRAALAANQRVTGDLQRAGSTEQRDRALSDAFITSANASELADGLGSGLGKAYRSLESYTSHDDGANAVATGSLPTLQTLLGYATAISAGDSSAAKYLFGAGYSASAPAKCLPPQIDGAAAILERPGATTDVYGQAYLVPATGTGATLAANACGDSRPFQTDSRLAMYAGLDYWGVPSGNALYLDGPVQDIRMSPSFPSGHTTYGYTQSVLLGILWPERYAQMVTRGAEYGNSRIVLGAHYAMDVLGGRTIALYDLAHLLANDPRYLNASTKGGTTVADFTAALAAAKLELHRALAAACRKPGATCATDTGRFHDPAANAAFYDATQTYQLPAVNDATAQAPEDVATVAPEAGYLLTAAFPTLTLKQADDILTSTEGPGGGFLDTGSAFGLYSRINLYRAVVAASGTR